ncbi:hypothetical protein [Dyella sp. S184]|uniref:hypothetical protein n=1 Tax=Dyella sp. S184 TaxID=1641862 RepID=UPI00131E8F77|nr:hypothetical protein [Dyella sp. S184]
MPTPLGFSPIGSRVPKFRAFEEKILPPGILLEYYLTDHDFQDVLDGHSKTRNSALSITMSREMYGHDFSEDNFLGAAYFRRVVEGKNFGKDEAAENEKKKVDAEANGVIPHLATDGKWLGVFLDQHDAIGVASISNDGSRNVLSLSVTVRVKNRYIKLGCGRVVNTDAEIQPFENICSKWARDILKYNPSS